MRYRHVCLEAVIHELPPHRVTSGEIESRLSPLYDRLGLPAGRLELMTGIRERRFFDPGTRPGTISARTVRRLLDLTEFPPRHIGALIHGSVCRDQLEPATASGVHRAAGLPQSPFVFDVSNACLGLLNGMLIIADLIELGRIQAGIVVGTEVGRPLVEGTIDALLRNTQITRQAVKGDFASLTIGSGSAAILLCHREISTRGHRLMGGAVRSDTRHNQLCSGDNDALEDAAGRPRMTTNSEALLQAGVDLAKETWDEFCTQLDWSADSIDRVFTHQVGRAHRKLLLDRTGLDPSKDFPTVEYLGNTGAVALPTALSRGVEADVIAAGNRVALMGIGSGLSCVMLGLEWGGPTTWDPNSADRR